MNEFSLCVQEVLRWALQLGASSPQQHGFNRIAPRKCRGLQVPLSRVCVCVQFSLKMLHTCPSIKRVRRGMGAFRGNCPGEKERDGQKPGCISWPLLSTLCICLSVTTSPSPSVINDQPSACLNVHEQTTLLSSYVETTSPAGFLNKYSVVQWAHFVTGRQITKSPAAILGAVAKKNPAFFVKRE